MDSTLPPAAITGPDWLVSSGLVTYPDAIAAMTARIAAIRAGTAGERVWLLEHPPLYTAGSSARPADLSDPETFRHLCGRARRPMDLSRPRPGGGLCHAGPHAAARHRAAARHPCLCERAGSLADCHPCALRRARRKARRPRRSLVEDSPGGTENKIAAIGVRITRWVTWHGISLNVCPALDHFSGIVPCGIRDHGVTSLRALGRDVTIEQARDGLRSNWAAIFGEPA